MNFHPDVLAAHAQFGGDLESMQKCYDWPDLNAKIAALEKENAELLADCQRKDELLTAAVDDYNDARNLAIKECAKIAEGWGDTYSVGYSVSLAIARLASEKRGGEE